MVATSSRARSPDPLAARLEKREQRSRPLRECVVPFVAAFEPEPFHHGTSGSPSAAPQPSADDTPTAGPERAPTGTSGPAIEVRVFEDRIVVHSSEEGTAPVDSSALRRGVTSNGNEDSDSTTTEPTTTEPATRETTAPSTSSTTPVRHYSDDSDDHEEHEGGSEPGDD